MKYLLSYTVDNRKQVYAALQQIGIPAPEPWWTRSNLAGGTVHIEHISELNNNELFMLKLSANISIIQVDDSEADMYIEYFSKMQKQTDRMYIT